MLWLIQFLVLQVLERQPCRTRWCGCHRWLIQHAKNWLQSPTFSLLHDRVCCCSKYDAPNAKRTSAHKEHQKQCCTVAGKWLIIKWRRFLVVFAHLTHYKYNTFSLNAISCVRRWSYCSLFFTVKIIFFAGSYFWEFMVRLDLIIVLMALSTVLDLGVILKNMQEARGLSNRCSTALNDMIWHDVLDFRSI